MWLEMRALLVQQELVQLGDDEWPTFERQPELLSAHW